MLNTAVSRRALLRAAATGAASATAVALVGCGGDDAGTLPTAVRPSPTEAPLTEASTPASSSSARWSQVARSATHPPALRDMSLTLGTNGKIYMFGGRAAGVVSNATWEFDPPAASWREIMAQGASPEARFGHNAWFDVARNRLVIALGQGDGSAFFDDVWSLSPASEIWTQLDASSAERPEKRYGAAGAYDPSGDRLVISHGFTSRGRFDDTWFFDIAGGSWSKLQTSGAVPLKRCLTRGAWSADRKVFLLFGGQSNEVPYLGDFWALETAAGIWTEKKPAVLPGPRNLYGAAFDIRAGRWFIAGGQTADGPSDECWTYELATDVWSRIPAQSPPAARHSLDFAGTRSKFYMFGGSTGQGETDEMWQLELGSS